MSLGPDLGLSGLIVNNSHLSRVEMKLRTHRQPGSQPGESKSCEGTKKDILEFFVGFNKQGGEGRGREGRKVD